MFHYCVNTNGFSHTFIKCNSVVHAVGDFTQGIFSFLFFVSEHCTYVFHLVLVSHTKLVNFTLNTDLSFYRGW